MRTEPKQRWINRGEPLTPRCPPLRQAGDRAHTLGYPPRSPGPPATSIVPLHPLSSSTPDTLSSCSGSFHVTDEDTEAWALCTHEWLSGHTPSSWRWRRLAKGGGTEQRELTWACADTCLQPTGKDRLAAHMHTLVTGVCVCVCVYQRV